MQKRRLCGRVEMWAWAYALWRTAGDAHKLKMKCKIVKFGKEKVHLNEIKYTAAAAAAAAGRAGRTNAHKYYKKMPNGAFNNGQTFLQW